MLTGLKKFGRFLTTMDAKAATSLFVSATLLAFVLAMFFFGQHWLALDDEEHLASLLLKASQSSWAVPILISIFVVLALTGFPQILLIAATILTFGPRDGAFYSWLATMISATFTFWFGHWFGGRFVRRFGGARTQSTIEFIGRHGIIASGLIRMVPSAPFIVVNAAAGASHIPLWKYWVGTGAGIVPKIALVATLGAVTPNVSSMQDGVRGILDFFTGREPRDLALLFAVLVGWLGFLYVVRRLYVSLRRRDIGQ